jgi:hypothetical protein
MVSAFQGQGTGAGYMQGGKLFEASGATHMTEQSGGYCGPNLLPRTADISGMCRTLPNFRNAVLTPWHMPNTCSNAWSGVVQARFLRYLISSHRYSRRVQ